jgi:hypothetical protein
MLLKHPDEPGTYEEAQDSPHSREWESAMQQELMMMMMMMIFIYVRRVTSEAGSPETSRRVWGRAKLWNYST